jgi:probable F420-dependent oxidoreductase
MFIDGKLDFGLGDSSQQAIAAEKEGYDAVWAAETTHDPFLTLASGALATERLQLGTGIVVAFGRSPMITALQANDLQLLSKGRLLLGLGSQIKPHIEKRYSMPWSHPAPRMREYILALHAIWSSWHESTKLEFRGDFYNHTLMTPFFDPGPNPYGAPKVFLAAVGEKMAEVAGEVADGLLVHPFSTERYLREVTLPVVERSLAKSGRSRDDFQVSYSGFVVTGSTEAERAAAKAAVQKQIAFYGSTPAYRPVFELHGWGDLQPELNSLSRSGNWDEMAGLITDEVLETFAIVAPIDEVSAQITKRFGGAVDRFSFYAPDQYDKAYWHDVLVRVRADQAAAS